MTVPPLTVFLVDADPVFRLGLRIALEQRAEFRVLGEASTSQDALEQMWSLQTAATATATDAGSTAVSALVEVVVLNLGLGQTAPGQMQGLQLCGEIKRQFPQLAVLVLSAEDAPVLREAAQQMGADGFGLRDMPVRDLARLMQHIASPRNRLAGNDAAQVLVAFPTAPEGPVAYLRRTSLEEIDRALADIEQTAQRRLPYWYQLVLAGKYRELRAARWLVQKFYAVLPAGPSAPVTDPSLDSAGTPQPTPLASSEGEPASLPVGRTRAPGGALVNTAAAMPVVVGDVRSRVCEAVFRKLQFPLENRSGIPLEIDILRDDRARELLYTVLRCFEIQLDELEQSQVPPGQLGSKTPTFLQDLWQAVLVDFFGRYYTPPLDGLEQPIVAQLLLDGAIVQADILNLIPEVATLLGHLLFQNSLDIDGATYMATTPEALRRSQFLLENLVIAVGCGVMQPVLNRYADVESIKRSLYQRKMMSTRDVTRFRNDLSWRYRWDALVNEPKAIFESEYRLFALTPDGIQTQSIYAPRREELEALSGFQYVLTLALEARDAISPRLRSTISLVGSSVVFVLTEVVGRGIGLIGRGIAKGIGNTWQDIRYRQR